MNILQEIFSEQFLYALGWTLIHSLWQGAIIGLVIAGAMILLHKYTARLRYFIYSISLFVVAALAVVTFISSYTSYQHPDDSQPQLTDSAVYIASYTQEARTIQFEEKASGLTPYLNSIADYCRTHIPLFVMIWLLGMLASLLRFMGGYALVRRYRNHRVKPVMGEWDQRFKLLVDELRVNKNVRLLESALVKVPMAIGYLKPVVLLPLGVLNGVPAQQMEAILAHELAHIKRRDYLMNMIQSILEVIFFYHPVVWWLSGNIRIERENICDDIAITITGNTMEFAKALTNIQEINLTAPGLAAGLSGTKKNRLVHRIRRLAGKPKLHSGFTEGFIAASILVISLIGLSAAAMITYPAESVLDPSLTFEEVNTNVPDFIYYEAPMTIPDTVVKKEELTEKEQKEIQEAEAAIKAEMEAMEAQMAEELKAVEEQLKAQQQYLEAYEEAMRNAEFNKQEQLQEVQAAMEAYRAAMEEAEFKMQKSAQWTLPELYFRGSTEFFGDDSLVWTHKYPDNFYFHCDSLADMNYEHFDEDWEDTWVEFEDMHLDEALMEHEEELMRMDEKLEQLEMENLYFVRPGKPYFYDSGFNYDFDHEFNFDYGVSDRAKRLVTIELHEDDLIDHGREYIVVIGKKQMLINGEKQSRTVFRKYRRLVDSIEEPMFHDDADEFKVFIGH